MALRELALFAGAGGGILGGKLLGWRTTCAVEIDPFCRSVLFARQRDGYLDPFPIWDDVRTFDGKPWRGHVDIITGGFPCQDISSAGKRAGLNGCRSGLWGEMARIIGEVRPQFVLAENSPHLRTRGLVRVLKDLAGMGYGVRWGVLGDCHAGGATIGARMWVAAAANNDWQRAFPIDAKACSPQESTKISSSADSLKLRIEQRRRRWEDGSVEAQLRQIGWEQLETSGEGNSNGLANRMVRTRATGNGQVASLAALAWTVLAGK